MLFNEKISLVILLLFKVTFKSSYLNMYDISRIIYDNISHMIQRLNNLNSKSWLVSGLQIFWNVVPNETFYSLLVINILQNFTDEYNLWIRFKKKN